MLYVAIWYVSIRPVVMRVKEELQFFLHPHNNRMYQIATYSIRTLLKMDYWSPKHVELLNVMNKINHQILCMLLDYIYILDMNILNYRIRSTLVFKKRDHISRRPLTEPVQMSPRLITWDNKPMHNQSSGYKNSILLSVLITVVQNAWLREQDQVGNWLR